jgi:hypothetical protein
MNLFLRRKHSTLVGTMGTITRGPQQQSRPRPAVRRALSAAFLPILVLVTFTPANAASGPSRSDPSVMCVDRALRRLLDQADGSSTCDQPRLATDFCHGPVGTSCQSSNGAAKPWSSSSSLPNAKNHPRAAATDACGLVTHALWVEAHQVQGQGQQHWQDPSHSGRDVVVVIPAGTCLGPMKAGPVHQDQLENNRTFVNEPVVTMRVNGTHLLELLEHGLELRYVLLQRNAQPRVSGMQFWVRPVRNRTRILRPTVLHRDTCQWKAVQSTTTYSLVTVPSMVKQSRHLWNDVPIHPVQFIDDSSSSSSSIQNRSSTMTVAAAVRSYARKVCQVEDPVDMVGAILRWGNGDSRRRRSGGGGIHGSSASLSSSSPSPVCAASKSPRKKATTIRAQAANRTYHSRLATW